MPKNKYAIIMTSTSGLLPGVNAVLNGLDYYDNKGFDFYLINDFERAGKKDYLEQTKLFNFPVISLKLSEFGRKLTFPKKKRSGWQVRFYRWELANQLADSYDAILVIDADMAVTNNIMQYFKIAADTGYIIGVNNPVGYSLEGLKEKGCDVLRGASTPPIHCMPLFFDGKKWKKLLDLCWKIGVTEDWGDMSSLVKAMCQMDIFDQVYRLPNYLWIQTWFYHDGIEMKQAGPKEYLLYGKERINMVHGRWWIQSVCAKWEGIKEPELVRFGKGNTRAIWETFKRLNTTHKIKLDWGPYSWYKDEKK